MIESSKHRLMNSEKQDLEIKSYKNSGLISYCVHK